jgi:hypothetical protein
MNPIFKNQLCGLSITELTALLSRRSVYCSATANGTRVQGISATEMEANGEQGIANERK